MGSWRWGPVVGSLLNRHQHGHIMCGRKEVLERGCKHGSGLAINHENRQCEYTSVQNLLLVRDLE